MTKHVDHIPSLTILEKDIRELGERVLDGKASHSLILGKLDSMRVYVKDAIHESFERKQLAAMQDKEHLEAQYKLGLETGKKASKNDINSIIGAAQRDHTQALNAEYRKGFLTGCKQTDDAIKPKLTAEYDRGYAIGKEAGVSQIDYNAGYNKGKSDGMSASSNALRTAEQKGYDRGFKEGELEGSTLAAEYIDKEHRKAYDKGYNDGKRSKHLPAVLKVEYAKGKEAGERNGSVVLAHVIDDERKKAYDNGFKEGKISGATNAEETLYGKYQEGFKAGECRGDVEAAKMDKFVPATDSYFQRHANPVCKNRARKENNFCREKCIHFDVVTSTCAKFAEFHSHTTDWKKMVLESEMRAVEKGDLKYAIESLRRDVTISEDYAKHFIGRAYVLYKADKVRRFELETAAIKEKEKENAEKARFKSVEKMQIVLDKMPITLSTPLNNSLPTQKPQPLSDTEY